MVETEGRRRCITWSGLHRPLRNIFSSAWGTGHQSQVRHGNRNQYGSFGAEIHIFCRSWTVTRFQRTQRVSRPLCDQLSLSFNSAHVRSQRCTHATDIHVAFSEVWSGLLAQRNSALVNKSCNANRRQQRHIAGPISSSSSLSSSSRLFVKKTIQKKQ